MKHKKKDSLPAYSRYAFICLVTVLAIGLLLALTLCSERRYSGRCVGEVTDIFYVMPNQSGDSKRLCEITFNVEGREYEVRTGCPGSTRVGDKCKVKYRPKRPGSAIVSW